MTDSGLTNQWRSLAGVVFVCVGLLSSLAADPQSSGEKAPQYTNHLINEKSPYLLQHAHTPVDWYPWGEEAFAKARKENKPIFLSIGYSTCHWCHVMERESYSDPEIASIMNAHFVCVKVDREERPDVDNIYLTFVEATTGYGGWPMNVWLTPDLKRSRANLRSLFSQATLWGRRSVGTSYRRRMRSWQNPSIASTEALAKLQNFLDPSS